MRIACSTSAFDVDLGGALSEVARLGFRFVDLICIPGWSHILPGRLAESWDEAAAEVEAELRRRGLTPVAVNLAVGNLYQRDSGHEQRLREVEAVARLMRRLGVPVGSFYPGYRCADRPWEDLLRDEAATVREVLDIGRAHGVVLAVELHKDTPFETVEQGRALLEAVPELGVAYDPSHFAMQGIDVRETAPFVARAAHVHLRSAAPGRMQAPLTQGTVDFDWLLAELRAQGYAGDVSLEYLPGLPGGPDAEILALRDRVMRLWEGAEA